MSNPAAEIGSRAFSPAARHVLQLGAARHAGAVCSALSPRRTAASGAVAPLGRPLGERLLRRYPAEDGSSSR